MSIYGTKEHLDLVQKVLKDKSTAYYPKWENYITFFFSVKDKVHFPKRIESSDLEVFTEKIRIASAEYLRLHRTENK